MNNEKLPVAKTGEPNQSKSNRFLLFALPIGHLVNDWPGAALWILAPAIALSMNPGPAEVGLLLTIHAGVASLAYLPAGLVGDLFRNRGNLLALTFWWVALGYFVASGTDNFWFAVMDGVGALGAVLAGIAGEYELRYAFAFCAGMAAVAMALTLVHRFSESNKVSTT